MIIVSYGADYAKDTYRVLSASDIGGYLRKDFAVSIKPNLVVPCPAWDGATTHPEVVEGIILFLKDFGIKKIKIIESAWVGDSTKEAFKHCGYEALTKKYGVPLVDLKTDACTTLSYGGLDIEVCNEALETDFLINVPVLKAHCQTKLTCCMKNLKGCIPDREKRRFHTLGLHKPIAALNMLIKTGYCVVDGICGDLSFEEGGNPVTANRIMAGRDPLELDSYAAELIGYHPTDIGYLAQGKAMGVGSFFSQETQIVELNPDAKPKRVAKTEHKADRYKQYIAEDAACSACYASLIYALHKSSGRLDPGKKIYIGQGYKGKSGTGPGVGNCARGFAPHVPGCPPTAADIINALMR